MLLYVGALPSMAYLHYLIQTKEWCSYEQNDLDYAELGRKSWDSILDHSMANYRFAYNILHEVLEPPMPFSALSCKLFPLCSSAAAVLASSHDDHPRLITIRSSIYDLLHVIFGNPSFCFIRYGIQLMTPWESGWWLVKDIMPVDQRRCFQQWECMWMFVDRNFDFDTL